MSARRPDPEMGGFYTAPRKDVSLEMPPWMRGRPGPGAGGAEEPAPDEEPSSHPRPWPHDEVGTAVTPGLRDAGLTGDSDLQPESEGEGPLVPGAEGLLGLQFAAADIPPIEPDEPEWEWDEPHPSLPGGPSIKIGPSVAGKIEGGRQKAKPPGGVEVGGVIEADREKITDTGVRGCGCSRNCPGHKEQWTPPPWVDGDDGIWHAHPSGTPINVIDLRVGGLGRWLTGKKSGTYRVAVVVYLPNGYIQVFMILLDYRTYKAVDKNDLTRDRDAWVDFQKELYDYVLGRLIDQFYDEHHGSKTLPFIDMEALKARASLVTMAAIAKLHGGTLYEGLGKSKEGLSLGEVKIPKDLKDDIMAKAVAILEKRNLPIPGQ